MAMLGTFALECEGTEVHLLSVLLPTVPSFFALLFGLRRLAEQALRRAGRPTWLPTAALSVAVPLWLSTIAYRPRLDNLSWSKGEWTILSSRPKSDNRLAHLRFRQPGHPGFREFSSHVSDHDWDVAVNAAAMFVDQLADDDEEILIVMPTQLIAFHSFTRDLGGRYRYLFYLVRMGLLDRKGFDALVPPDFVAQILRRPPRLVVASTGTMPRLLEVIPELQTIGKKYRVAGRFGVALVLQRTDDGMAQSESGREARP